MAWVTPPTFVDGNVLTATQLNQLSDAVRYLNGLGASPNVISAEVGNIQGVTSYWFAGRHTNRYLKCLYIGNANSDYLKIYYGATLLYNDGDPYSAGNAQWATLDLQTLIPALAVGDWYRLEVQMHNNTNGTLSVLALYEATSA